MEATTPSWAKRGMSSGWSSWACSMRLRRRARHTAWPSDFARLRWNASSTRRLAASPIAWMAEGMPARAAGTMASSISSWGTVRYAALSGLALEGREHLRGRRRQASRR